VLVTGWGGFYLGSMLSGISSVQRGLLDTLLGIGLVSAGAGALNEALERKTDARMKRTADRPLASGRFSLARASLAGLGALALGAVWLMLHTNALTLALALLTAFTYVAIYTPLKRVTAIATFIGAFPGAMGPLLGLDRRARPHRVAGRGSVRHSLCLAVSSLHGHQLALSRRLRARRHPHVAGGAAGRMVHRGRGAVLRGGHDSREPVPWWLGMAVRCVCGAGGGAGAAVPGVYDPLRGILRTSRRNQKAACWRAIC
jgi:hypothetical protein